MIDENAILPDNIRDPATFKLKAMLNEDGWTSTKSRLRYELVQHLQNEHYIEFEGCPYRYHITKVGESYLYDVPLYKQGFLKKYRGKRVRIVCVGAGGTNELTWREWLEILLIILLLPSLITPILFLVTPQIVKLFIKPDDFYYLWLTRA